MAEWETYRCTIPEGTGSKSGDGTPLRTVYHIVHLPAARRILEDGCLRAGLIYDESKLNRSRTCVTWLSANTWIHGSIYGNVQFAFDWAEIIGNRDVYWVDAMTPYKPHAYRFLLTDRDMSKSKHVTPYDPETNKGPLRMRNGKWFWNDNYTSEFMLEGDVLLKDCTSLRFISHHPTICRRNGHVCQYREINSKVTGGCVLALLLGATLDAADRALRKKSDGKIRLTREAQNGVGGICRALGSKKKCFTGGIKKSESRRSVIRGALALHGTEQYKAAKELVGLLQSQKVFKQALVEIIEEHFNITGYKLPNY